MTFLISLMRPYGVKVRDVHPFPFRFQGFKPAPLVALRTCKADVVAGLAPGQSQALTAADADWLVDGKWGMVQAAWL